MKKTLILIVCLCLALTLFTACSGSGSGSAATETQAPAGPLVGEWDGEKLISEVWTFNADGSGHNENTFLSYDFDYTYSEADSLLSIYTYLGSLKSETPSEYTVIFNSDTEIVLKNENFEYVLTKK